MSPWRRLDGDPGRLELHPRQPQHFRRAVDADRLARTRPEQLDHPPGPGADVDQPAERALAKRAVDRALDLAFGDMERTDLVPDLGMAGEIAAGGFGPLGADGLGARGVGSEQRPGRRVGPVVDQREHRLDLVGVGQGQEHPAALLAPLEHAGIGEDLQVARDARLALAEHLRQLADRQLHQPQQARRCAAASGRRAPGIGRRAEARQSLDKDIKISLYGQFREAKIIPCRLVGIAAIAARSGLTTRSSRPRLVPAHGPK